MRTLLTILFSLLIATASFASRAAVPDILLANVYRDGLSPADYWVSEKLDGVRGLWDGKALRTRAGNPIAAPAWFTAGLPPEALDGELWIGRGRFDEVSAIVRRTEPVDAEWRQVRYMLFELPGGSGDFSARIAQMQAVVKRTGTPWVQVIEQVRVADAATLKRKLAEVVKTGGEGLMLHLANAPYQTGRSDVLLKLKPYLDTEAKVIGHVPGKGKYAGQTGALLMEMPDGKRFKLGSGLTDALRTNPPPIGSLVTYRYRDLTPGGLPRFASFLRVREP